MLIILQLHARRRVFRWSQIFDRRGWRLQHVAGGDRDGQRERCPAGGLGLYRPPATAQCTPFQHNGTHRWRHHK